MKMIPWWGVLISCIVFGVWTAIAAMVGASIAINAKGKEKQYRPKQDIFAAPDDISDIS